MPSWPGSLVLRILVAPALLTASSGCRESEVDLVVEIDGYGHVVGTGGEIDCARRSVTGVETGSCWLDSRETVTETLDATPLGGATFVGWTYSISHDCTGGKCLPSAPTETFTAQGARATVPLLAYPNHAHVRVVATFTAP